MECELCGRSCECRPAAVDGVRMMLCPGCMKHGKGIKVPTAPTTMGTNKSMLGRIRKHRVKDVYKDMDRELVSNFNEIIKNARQKKGISREDLGFKIGERTVTISKIENGDLKPSDKIIKQLEKELGISLLEEVKSISLGTSSSNGRGLTLGDFIKTEKK